MKFTTAIIAFTFSLQGLFAQEWVDMMTESNANFYEVQAAFNEYWGNAEYERGKGYKQYKRWEYFMEPRVYPSGERLRSDLLFQAHKAARKAMKENAKSSTPWQAVGPTSWESQGWNPGLGRVNAIVVDPSVPERVYACTPSGGLWTSEDNGESWEPMTDNLPAIGVSGIAINPTDSDELYISTGDGNGGDTYSIGVLKSTDGGETWEPTGLNHEVSDQLRTSKILMHPTDFDTLWAATSVGVYTTYNGGASWSQSVSDNIRDIEINPANPDIIYASGRRFYRSTDAGDNFTQITDGVPSFSTVNRLAIAVTEADDDYVYMVAGSQEDSGFEGLYRSTDGGLSFELRSDSPNILTYSEVGDGVGGQSWYDLAIAASPEDEDLIFVGGINVWSSANGGTAWNIRSHWIHPPFIGYTHADIHSLDFYGNTLYCGSDGGAFYSTNSGAFWEDISEGLQISQFYRMAVSTDDDQLILTASQDNGTNLFSNGDSYLHLLGGDGNAAAIDYNNSNIMYSAYPGGSFQRSTNGGASFSDFTAGITEGGAWVTPLELHPTDPSTLFAAYENVWRRDGEAEWEIIGNIPGSGTLRALRVAPSDPSTIYTGRFGQVFKTTDGGENWTSISGGLPNLAVTAIEVDPFDPMRVWVSFSGYSEGNKVFMSENGGSDWENVSINLPNIPVNCISYQLGTNDAIYVGTDVGLYYKAGDDLNWASFNEGLPNVIVNQIFLHYASSQVFIATYGRGVWVNDFFDATAAQPVALFNADRQLICEGETVSFSNLSINVSDNFTWYFDGGNPSTTSNIEPTVTYGIAGTYPVKLVAANENGIDSLIAEAFITVIPAVGSPQPFFEDFEEEDALSNATWFRRSNNGEPQWELNPTEGFESTQSVWIENFNTADGNREFLESSTIDLSNLDTAIVTFYVAYAERESASTERLRVLLSTDCGESWSLKQQFNSTSTLPTVEPQMGPFQPSGDEDWGILVVDNIEPQERTENVRLGFEFRSAGGNNIFLDRINIVESYSVSVRDQKETFGTVSLFPNPAKTNSRLEFEHTGNGVVTVDILDVLGRKVDQIQSGTLSKGYQTIDFSTEKLKSGVYNVVIQSEDGQQTLKLVIER